MSRCEQQLPPPHAAAVYSHDGTPILVSELAFRAHNSTYGQYMDSQPLRFNDNFGYERQSMLRDLGPDVHPIGHQNEVTRHFRHILEAERPHISREEEGIAMLTCRIHDMGESMHPRIAKRIGQVVGDIPAGQKSDEERKAEQNVRHFLYEELFPDVHPEILERMEGLIMHQPLPGDEYLHELVELAHEVGTFDTALKAKEAWQAREFFHEGELMDIAPYDGGRTSGTLGLYRAVFWRTGVTLLEQLEKHSNQYVADMLSPHIDELTRYQEYRDQQGEAA